MRDRRNPFLQIIPVLLGIVLLVEPFHSWGIVQSSGELRQPHEEAEVTEVPKGTDRPNVLFLAVDDMKDWVNCLGGYEGKVFTPHIDQLAAQGILFSNAHCPSPKCAPSRAAILTGLMPSTTGLYDNGHWWFPNLPDVVTIPKHFRNHGYNVVGAGKIFHHTAGNHPPNQWDRFLRLTFRNDPWFRGARINYPWSTHRPYPVEFPFSGVAGLGHENDWGSLSIPDASYDDALSADFAIQCLNKADRKPFFLACGLFRPHLPWYVPERFFDFYPIEEVILPDVLENDLLDVPEPGVELALSRQKDFNVIRKANQWKNAVQAYLASISYADFQLGRILKTLDQGPHAANTIVVLWSDHGWHLGEKNHWHKSTLWEEATRVPLIIRSPKFKSGICRQAVNLIDLFPTLIELCSLNPVPNHDGLSLVPLIIDPGSRRKHPSVSEFRRGNVAVRSNRYRFIRYHDGTEELYDHSNDPNEWHNLSDRADLTNVKKRLSKWMPSQWAEDAPTKSAFRFDPDRFIWTHSANGRTFDGQR